MAITIGEKRILRSALEPPNTNWLWLKTDKGSPALYEYLSGKWVPFFGSGSSDLQDKYITGISVNGGTIQYPVSGIVSLTIEGGEGYSPPLGGIPKKDLSSDVQVSLSKADTALQAQQQSDWSEDDDSAPGYIRHKPTIPTVSAWAQQPTKPAYTAQEVGALPNTAFIPTKVSDLPNDAGYATTAAMTTALAGKQDTLTFDTTPTANSTKPVTSGGIKTYVDNKATITGITTSQDGTFTISLSDGNSYTIYLNHTHPQYVESEDLATVATSGSYNDLEDKPSIPSLSGYVKFWTGTQAAYDALAPNYDSDTLYLIPETTT